MSGPTEYSAKVPSGTVGASSITSSPFTKFTPGQTLYFSYNYSATRTSGSASETAALEIQWYDNSNTLISNPTNNLSINGTTSGFLTKEFIYVVPATAVKGIAVLTVTPGSGTMQHDVYIAGLRLAPTALGANIGAIGDANRGRFSRFEKGTQGWDKLANGGATIANFFTGIPTSGSFSGLEYIRIDGTFSSTSSTNVVILNDAVLSGNRSFRIPVTPGERLFVGAKIEVQAANPAWIWVLNAAFKNDASADVGSYEAQRGTGSVTFNTPVGGFVTVPSGAVYLSLELYLFSAVATGAYVLAMREPIVCGAAPYQTEFPPFTPGPSGEFGADVTANVVGPAAENINYDSTGATFQSADDMIYRAVTAAGNITSGLTASFKVQNGTFNGFTLASGAQTLTLTSGVATITPTSMGTATADLEITFVYNGRTLPPFTTSLTKVLAAPGGGGSGGSGASQNTGFTSIAAGSWGTQTVISNTLNFTTASGQTSVTLAIANFINRCPKSANQEGPWNVEYRWQRLISGTWTDVATAVQTDPDLALVDTEIGVGVSSGSATNSQSLGSLSGSTAYSFRLTAKATSGTLATNVAMNFFCGSGGSIGVS